MTVNIGALVFVEETKLVKIEDVQFHDLGHLGHKKLSKRNNCLNVVVYQLISPCVSPLNELSVNKTFPISLQLLFINMSLFTLQISWFVHFC